MITKIAEEYIKTMYVLEKQKGEIRVTDIAKKMKCTKAGVSKTIKKLKEEEYIYYEIYGKIKLTKQGIQIAQKALEAYDIIKVFLKEVLEVNEEQVEEEARNIKKVLADETLNKLAIYIHKVLGLNPLDCGYDINKKRCRECLRRTKGKDTDEKR